MDYGRSEGTAIFSPAPAFGAGHTPLVRLDSVKVHGPLYSPTWYERCPAAHIHGRCRAALNTQTHITQYQNTLQYCTPYFGTP